LPKATRSRSCERDSYRVCSRAPSMAAAALFGPGPDQVPGLDLALPFTSIVPRSSHSNSSASSS
jgi:hypothetical protein